jgi:hypothetical protein
MKKRYLYALLFGIPGLFVAGVMTLLLFGTVMGVLWLYVFGDNPWPDSVDKVLSITLALTFLILWISTITLGYFMGRKFEADPVLNNGHILVAGGLTFVCVFLIVLQQFSVGNLGPKSDSTICSEYCLSQGYSASGLPPRDAGDKTCSCFDDFGKEVLKIPLESIPSDASK